MKLPFLIYILLCHIACGQEVKSDKIQLFAEFKVESPKVLEHPYSGKLESVWPVEKKGAEPEIVRLNFLRPAKDPRPNSTINSPTLSTTDDGKVYSGEFALKPDLPSSKNLTSIADYNELVDLLGVPTHPAMRGDLDDEWAYDTVSWRLFAPLNANSVEILDVSVDRKYSRKDRENRKFLIEKYSIHRGTLTKSEQAGAGQPATAPESKPEGIEKPKPESEPAPK